MTETIPNPIVDEEVERIRFLSGLTDRPGVFLFAQNELLYDRDISHLHQTGELGERGLPTAADDFYQIDVPERPQLTTRPPRVLNIGSGGEASRKLDAINVDVSIDGQPEVMANAQQLPFRAGAFSVVRASHVLEHIPQDRLLPTLLEWKRVLDPNGELQIAVPDAEITFKEIVDGVTPKGAPAYSLTETTAPLAQIYGLDYENPQTDPRWGHRVIFSQALLAHVLHAAGFTQVDRRPSEEDLAAYCQVKDDSQNHYSLLVSASNEKLPHTVDQPLPEKTFMDQCRAFCEQHPDVSPATYIVPVQNESKNLRHFLAFLENSSNNIGADREFIFVVNGCSDASEAIIKEYLAASYLNGRIVHSDKGIVSAFRQGIAERALDGFVGKLDADTILHPHSLDLMHMFLTEQDDVQVTYAEPMPLDSQSAFNEAEHNPLMRSRRLYYHGRASLYRQDPWQTMNQANVPSTLQAEDIFLSFYFAYFFGLDSMARTPHALVFGKTIKSFEDLVQQTSRSNSEIERVYQAYPPFRVLSHVLEREIYPSRYHALTEQARGEAGQATEWTRLRTTK